MKTEPTKLRLLSAVFMIILPFTDSLAASSPIKQAEQENIEGIFDILREHTSYGLNSQEYAEALAFNPGKNLKALRNPFETSFQVKDPKRNPFNSIGATFTYTTGIPDPSAPYGSGKMMPHTFAFGRPPTIQDPSRYVLDLQYEKRIFQKSSYFLSDQNHHNTGQYLLAPLRMDKDLLVMAASMGSQFNPDLWTQNPKERIPGPQRTPRKLVLLIGVRTDEIDKLGDVNNLSRQNEFNISKEQLMQYQVRIGTMTNEELELASQEQIKKMPGSNELERHNNEYQTLDINQERVTYNLASRDMRDEVRDLVERAAAKVPGFNKRAMEMFESGGFGIMQARDGTQYLVQSLMIPVYYPYHPTFIDNEIPDLVKALIDPQLQLRKKILLPKDIKKGLALLKTMKEERSELEAKKAMSKASQTESAEAQVIVTDLMSRLRAASGSPNGGPNSYYKDTSNSKSTDQCKAHYSR